jgi:nicotinamidase/pyrazinamidase
MARIPGFHDPARVGTLFHPDAAAIAADAEQAGLRPVAEDRPRVHLLLIDMQVDFCHKGGALYVPGAEDDIRRIIRFIYANAERISNIACTLDSHHPFQIFHPAWWTNADGRHPEPFTVIAAEDVESGIWKPVLQPIWSREYVVRLRRQAKKDLVVWPYHVPIGGLGNALDPELWSAVFWHSIARRSQPALWIKGSIPQTEHYSILRPEVPVDDQPASDRRRDFLALFDRYDYILLAGEAETHCVLETVRDLVELLGCEPEKLARILILRDCMSPVRHPQIDFHAMAVEQFKTFEQQGVRFIRSGDPLPFQP